MPFTFWFNAYSAILFSFSSTLERFSVLRAYIIFKYIFPNISSTFLVCDSSQVLSLAKISSPSHKFSEFPRTYLIGISNSKKSSVSPSKPCPHWVCLFSMLCSYLIAPDKNTLFYIIFLFICQPCFFFFFAMHPENFLMLLPVKTSVILIQTLILSFFSEC